MYLEDLNETFDHRISGGDYYLWHCYPNARFLEYKSNYADVSAIFNTETQEVYEVHVSVDINTWDPDIRPYRWLNPEFKDAHDTEAKNRDIDPTVAWDDVKWIDLESADDFLEKALAIFNGDDSFDKRIQVPLDLNEDEILKIALMAHKRDITLNKMVEEIIQLAIEKHKEDHE
jgi:hypothetical protein